MRIDIVTRFVSILLCVLVLQGCAGMIATSALSTGAIAVQDRRTPGTSVDDELIEIKILSAIFNDPELSDQGHINVTSFNGLVLLTGEAPGESLRTRATEMARGIPKVQGVQNEVGLSAPSSLLARASDTVITGKVKFALLEDEMLNPIHIKVVTERGIVYLMGLVNQAEADRAAEVARHVGGVQRVVKVMEYVE